MGGRKEGVKIKEWKEKYLLLYKGRGGRGRVLEEAPDRAHLQLSQIISAREVRGGKMSKYLNKFHRSLLREGQCGEREYCWGQWGGEGMTGLGNKMGSWRGGAGAEGGFTCEIAFTGLRRSTS